MVCGFGNLDTVRQPGGLKAACRIHGVPPDVVDRSVTADEASDDFAGMDSDTHFKFFVKTLPGLLHYCKHAECHVSDGYRMVRIFFWQPSGHHVGVSDRLDFLELQ